MDFEVIQTKVFKPVEVRLTFKTEREYKMFVQVIGVASDNDWATIANRMDSEDCDFELITNFTGEDKIFPQQLYSKLISILDK